MIAASAAALLAGCDAASRSTWLPKVLGVGERASRGAQRLVSCAPRHGAGIQHCGSVADSFAAMAPRTRITRTTRHSPRISLRDWRLQVDGLVRAPVAAVACALARHGKPHADHAPRLRRRMERHRSVDGRAAWRAAAHGGAAAGCALCRLPLRGSRWTRPGLAITRALISRTPTTRRRFSPTSLNGAALPIANGAPLRAAYRAAARLQDGEIHHAY